MSELDLQRRFFAEEIEAVCRLKSAPLVDAFAAVPRERFLPPGPWTVMADTDSGLGMAMAMKGGAPGGGLRVQTTPDDHPRRVYHNIGVAIDPSRSLFNGQPGTLATWLDALDLKAGGRVLHVGTGLGYYTAIMAHCVQGRPRGAAPTADGRPHGAAPTADERSQGGVATTEGCVVAYEVDEALAASARGNLATFPWVDVRHGDASAAVGGPFDAIVVNAGVTHPLDVWLDALAAGGRMILPLTSEMPAMASTLGKGLVVLVTKQDDGFAARVFTLVAVYSAIGIRDRELNERVSKALMGGPMQWAALKRLRRDPHDPAPTCWLHLPNCCFST